jgi:hypothetical protein
MRYLALSLFLPSVALAAVPQEGAPDAHGSGGTFALQQAAMQPNLPPGALAELGRRLYFDEPGDGHVWARSARWKASFGPGGFTYIPFFGSDAPQSFPVDFTLERVSVAGDDLPLEGQSAPSLDGQTVALERGTLREVYHVTAETIEQTFVFDTLPGAGDLRLWLDVETELAVRPHAGGWLFESQLGAVQYGSATAIDADGAHLALEQRWVDGGIEIVVPADFVAAARFPLVVDPVLSTLMVNDDSREQVDVDVAYDGINGVYMIVYEDVQSVSDHDVLTVFYNMSLGLLTNSSSIDITTSDWERPRVAGCYLEETFLCVAANGSIFKHIWGRTRNANDGSRGNQFAISSGSGTHVFPDVGGFGNDTVTSHSFLVVWQRMNPLSEADIVSQAVSFSGSLTGGVVVIAGAAGVSDRNPRISRSSGRAILNAIEHQYMVVWEREVAAGDRDLYARVVDYDNDLTGHPAFAAYTFSDSWNADVSMQHADVALSPDPFWVIAFERLRGTDYDIFTIVARDGDADNARSVPEMQDIAEEDEQSDPRITFEGQDYMLLYESEAPGGGRNAYFTALNVVSDGNELRTGVIERRTAVRALDGGVQTIAISSDFEGGADFVGIGDYTAFGLWVAPGTSGTDGDVGGAFLAEETNPVLGSQYCRANVNASGKAAWIRVYGINQFIAGGSKSVQCLDLPPNSFAYFMCALGNAVTANPGGSAGNLCLSGSIGRYSPQVMNSGPTGTIFMQVNPQSLPQPMGSVSATAGETWNFQCWTRDSQGGVATSNFSNAIAVTFL